MNWLNVLTIEQLRYLRDYYWANTGKDPLLIGKKTELNGGGDE